MPSPPFDTLTVVRYAEGWGFAANEWRKALAGIDWSGPGQKNAAQRLKIRADGDATVWRARITIARREHDVVFKVDPLDSPWRLLRSWLGNTRHTRQWRGSELLTARGFAAARCVAILRARNNRGSAEMLVTETLRGPTVLELIASGTLSVRQQHALARAVGGLFAKFIHQGVIVRDPKPSNLIVLGWDRAGPRLGLVDTVDVRRGAMDPDAIVKAWLEPAGVGHRPRQTLAFLAIRSMLAGCRDASHLQPTEIRGTLRDTWSRAQTEIARHGNATPQDNPLRRDPDLS